MNDPCHHIGLFVFDIDKVTRFYIDQLGFQLHHEFTVDKKITKQIFGLNSSCYVRFLSLGNFGVELFYFDDVALTKHKAKTSGYNHWTLLVDNKLTFCERLKEKNAMVIKIPKPGGFTFFIKDPELNLIEIKNFSEVR